MEPSARHVTPLIYCLRTDVPPFIGSYFQGGVKFGATGLLNRWESVGGKLGKEEFNRRFFVWELLI